ncbi:MAG TPA: response regulator transcription factor [Gallionella sp.]|nr:response regulator transcription factor [Gallionella sp.]
MNVLIVEDSDAMRKSLRSMLSEFHEVRITGYAADEAAAIEHVNALLPDVVILDLNLLSGSGIAVLKDIKKNHAGIKVMVLTNCNGELYADACKRANADYFFDKSFQFMQVREVFLNWGHASQPDGRMPD